MLAMANCRGGFQAVNMYCCVKKMDSGYSTICIIPWYNIIVGARLRPFDWLDCNDFLKDMGFAQKILVCNFAPYI